MLLDCCWHTRRTVCVCFGALGICFSLLLASQREGTAQASASFSSTTDSTRPTESNLVPLPLRVGVVVIMVAASTLNPLST